MIDRKRGAALLALAATAALVMSGCTSSGSPKWNSAGSSSDGGSATSQSPGASAGPGNLSVTPANGAKSVAPADGILVNAGGSAKITSVTVKAGSKTIAGAVADDGHSWK